MIMTKRFNFSVCSPFKRIHAPTARAAFCSCSCLFSFFVFLPLHFLRFFSILVYLLFEAVPSPNMLVVRVIPGLFFTFAELFLPWLGLGTAVQWLHGCVVYSWDQLIALRPTGWSARTSEIPAEIWRRMHRGCRGGLKQWRKRDGSRQPRVVFIRQTVSFWGLFPIGGRVITDCSFHTGG